jgi:hypothetical protein
MSKQSNLVCLSILAGADLSAAKYTFVKLNSSGQVVQCSAAGEGALGILQNNPTSGQAATVCISGQSKIKLGGTVATGAFGATDAAGKLKAASAGVTNTSDAGAANDPAIGSFCMGIVTVGGVANDVGEILIEPMGVIPTTAA